MLAPSHLLAGAPDEVDARVTAALRRRGCERPDAGADPDDPCVGLWWLLRMAARTRRRRGALPAPSPERVARLEAQLARRPDRDERHGQLHVDAASTLRRADAVAALAGGGPILAVGDDDAVTLALAELGLEDVWAIDIDPRVLAFLRDASGGRVHTQPVDVLGGPVPGPLVRRFAVAVTDPFRDLDGGLGFLTFAAATVRPGGAIGWVDHPDWNFEHDVVREALARVGWRVEETLEDLHAYPLSAEAIELDALASAFPDDAADLAELVAHTSAWSHLHVLRRTAA